EKILRIKTYSEDNRVVAEVSDTGRGMTEEVKQKIFEPFFTTKGTGKGTGLGTSISFGIIKDYGGTIDIESEYGKGAKFIIRFPKNQIRE
ncbi:MAG: PAS domain-containing sensor histidine kinase, partial [Proteobacteria bacterium]|nr:PAS domain-containing sensor histidine kinase [Pseudomonadota bacterium]